MDTNIFTEGMTKGPEGEILRFFYDTARNDAATNAEGRPIFDTILMVDVITPGQKSSTPRFELERTWAAQSLKTLGITTPSKKSAYYTRFQEQIEKFKRQESPDMGGTPLHQWPRADRGLIATLMAANVYTVEQLAGISDQQLDIVGLGARELREQAKNYLEQAANGADTSALTAKNSDLETENKRLQEALALANAQATEFQKRLNALDGVLPSAKATSTVLPDITL